MSGNTRHGLDSSGAVYGRNQTGFSNVMTPLSVDHSFQWRLLRTSDITSYDASGPPSIPAEYWVRPSPHLRVVQLSERRNRTPDPFANGNPTAPIGYNGFRPVSIVSVEKIMLHATFSPVKTTELPNGPPTNSVDLA